MPLPDTDVVDRLLTLANQFPEAVAVREGDQRTTYAEFGAFARQIAAALAQITQQPRVLIYLPPGLNAYAAMFGTLMAGGYYCPVNVSQPESRKARIMEQFRPEVIIVSSDDQDVVSRLAPAESTLLSLENLPAQRLELPAAPHELAYVIFTSGSTGEPKGVMIKRKAVSHLTAWAIETTGAGVGDIWGQYSAIGFDLSVLDIYTCLCSGAALVPLSNALDHVMPGAAIKRYGLTIWNSVPSVVDLMRQANQVKPELLKSLRLMIFCGEPLLPDHLRVLFEANPSVLILNTYGPTEITVLCTCVRLTADDYARACDISVAIGDTIPGWNVRLVGGENADEGEVVIMGPYIAAGYWENPAATEKAFRPFVYDGQEYPAYYTGDWAERKNGFTFFRHRIDRQVKIRGFRVELGEIDHYIRAFGIANSHTLCLDNRIYSFLEMNSDVDTRALNAFLGEHLPSYAVPGEIRILPELPRNSSDKIDSRALLRLLQNTSNDSDDQRQPHGE